MAHSCRDLVSYIVHSWRTSTGSFKIVSLALLLSWIFFLSAMLRSLGGFNEVLPVSKYNSSLIGQRRIAACTATNPCRVQVIADLDVGNVIPDSPQHLSYLLSGLLKSEGSNEWDFEWLNASQPLPVVGNLAEAGRGMELSELVLYNGMMLAFDDRTGAAYELGVKQDLKQLRTSAMSMKSWVETNGYDFTNGKIEPLPRWVILEGDGQATAKGMKIEWACQKEGDLYVGSFGKEFTSPDGETVLSKSNLWVAIIRGGEIEYVDWEANYDALRQATGTAAPGYLLHEAVNWSAELNKWVFLPRRVSTEKYSELADEERGSDLMLIASEDFSDVKVVKINFNQSNPHQGFSSFKFIPGTQDRIIVALRSEEYSALSKQSTSLTIFDLDGNVALENFPVSSTYKFEGVEIW